MGGTVESFLGITLTVALPESLLLPSKLVVWTVNTRFLY